MRLKIKLSSPIQGTHQGSVGGLAVHLLIQHWKKVTKSVNCASWDCYDALLIATISKYFICYYTLIDFLKLF